MIEQCGHCGKSYCYGDCYGDAAQAIEARSGETGTGSTEGESAVRKDAPNTLGGI